MKTITKKITALILCMICACTGLVGLADEKALFDSRPNSHKHIQEISGLYQYGQFMDDEEAQACFNALQDTEIIEYIYDGLLRREEEIFLDIFDAPIYPEQLTIYVKAILNNYPDFYFVSNLYEYYIYDDGTLASLVPIYTMDYSEVAQKQALIDAEVEKICSGISEGMNDFDKIVAVHEYFVDNYSYDYKNLRDHENVSKFTIPGLFLDKTAVCQGYALGFMYVMNKLGIECLTVQSDAMSHLWNLVQLENGNWYHVDVTWDDPSQDWYDPYNKPTMSDENYALAMGIVRTYFMLSDNRIKSLNSPHYAYTPDGMALDDVYGKAGVFDVNTAIVWNNGGWYYVDNEGKLHRYNSADNSDKVVLEIEGGWPYIDASFAYVCEYNGKFYYNTATDIMKYDPVTGTSSLVVASPEGVGGKSLIYKMELEGSNLIYTVATDYMGANSWEGMIDLSTLPGNETPSPSPTPTPVPTATPIPTATPEPPVVEADIADGNTVVNIHGNVMGIVCAVDYEDGRLESVKLLDAAQTLTFDSIEADEIYVWLDTSSMLPLCETYVIKN